MWKIPQVVANASVGGAYVGSFALLGTGRDVDYAAFIPGYTNRAEVASALMDDGYMLDGSVHNGPGGADFFSLSKWVDGTKYNLLLCGDVSWRRYSVGQTTCAALRDMGVDMRGKPLRVFIHQLVGGATVEHALDEARKYLGL